MSRLVMDHLRSAYQSLHRTRSRTVLTVAGVAIGVASITAILSLSAGIRSIIDEQVTQAGNRLLVVQPSVAQSRLIDLGNPTPRTAYSTSPITERDLEAVMANTSVQTAAPLMTISGTVKSQEYTPLRSEIVATTPSFVNTTSFTMDSGDFLDQSSSASSAVLGQQIALDLFGTDQVIGKAFTIRGDQFHVSGVIKRQNNPINYNNIDLDYAIFVSLDSGRLFNSGALQLQQINIVAKAGVDSAQLQAELTKTLKKNHDEQSDVRVLTGKDISQPTSRLFLFVQIVMSAIAGISLIVGGIGIMNIMLVGVAERTREIGLRKAVGASNGSIVWQFLTESLLMSTFGGVVGYLGGMFVAFCVSLLLPYNPTLSWQVFGIAMGLSIGVGSIFGLFPAIRAARKDPIESLRLYR